MKEKILEKNLKGIIINLKVEKFDGKVTYISHEIKGEIPYHNWNHLESYYLKKAVKEIVRKYGNKFIMIGKYGKLYKVAIGEGEIVTITKGANLTEWLDMPWVIQDTIIGDLVEYDEIIIK